MLFRPKSWKIIKFTLVYSSGFLTIPESQKSKFSLGKTWYFGSAEMHLRTPYRSKPKFMIPMLLGAHGPEKHQFRLTPIRGFERHFRTPKIPSFP